MRAALHGVEMSLMPCTAGGHHLLRSMLGHVLQQEQRLVNMPPVLPLVLKTPCNNAHDLLVVLQFVGGLGDLCKRLA